KSGESEHEGTFVAAGVMGAVPGHLPHPERHLAVPEDRHDRPGLCLAVPAQEFDRRGKATGDLGTALEESGLTVLDDGAHGVIGVIGTATVHAVDAILAPGAG